MFDAETVALIRGAPALEDLDLDALPQRLTNAYASIVAARIRTTQTPPTTSTIPEDTAQTAAQMRRLAFTLEALVSTAPQREDRAAAAFVAGTAHHVALTAERLTLPARPSTLSVDALSPEVSATLLFLIAEATADAAEMSKAIVINTDDLVERALLEAVQHLAHGRLSQLLDAAPPAPDIPDLTSAADQATKSLYYMLLHGVRAMAALILGRQLAEATNPYTVDPQELFEQVRSLCVDDFDDLLTPSDDVAPSVFSGPLHMASLLSAVSRDLTPNAVINLRPPTGIDAHRWTELMRTVSYRRPYLWRNHQTAIEEGYLERGVSCVVSFPTGAGKSMLAELKVAAALLGGEKVVFLTPTLSLVDQTATTLRKAFPSARVQRERAEEQLTAFGDEEMPEISVLTPERCLALLCFHTETFSDVGLVVFDECHLLHARDAATSRRAVDAMLCILNLSTAVPTADFLLLSAMIMNAQAIAEWVGALTARPSIGLELTWKPTRQVRGCVVYASDEVSALQSRLRQVRRETRAKTAPAAVRRELKVHPLGFFCLRQTWHTYNRSDYTLLRLLDEPVVLATGTANDGTWYLTPNGNKVAAAIAAATAGSGLKTLVFTQSIPFATSAAKEADKRFEHARYTLTDEERRLYETAREEAGGALYLYLDVREDYSVVTAATAHHGLLLPDERRLHESLFRRADGIQVLVATSTLAQGMNLPSQVVIIAGDSRFDVEADGLVQLQAHELLNAAGRAGRAGENAHGVVVVVPSKVVHFDDDKNTIQQHWASLQAVFARSDACIEIEDPLVPLLDEIHSGATPLSEVATYMIRRLPRGGTETDGDLDGRARDLLARSLGAFVTRRRKGEEWVESRVEAALAARRADPAAPEGEVAWVEQLAAAAGLPPGLVAELGAWPDAREVTEDPSVCDWRDLVFDWLEDRPEAVPLVLRREGLEGLLGGPYKQLGEAAGQGRLALPVLKRLTREWMAGGTLAQMEVEFGSVAGELGKCKAAREFVLRVVPELAYFCALFSQAIGAGAGRRDLRGRGWLNAETLGPCVREGLDCPEKLALRWVRGRRRGRVGVHREFAALADYVGTAPDSEDFTSLLARIRRAVDAMEAASR